MKPIHCLPALVFFVSTVAFSGQVRTTEAAIKLAANAIHKFHLTTLKDECGSIVATEKSSYVEITVRERHTQHCGGTPETGPRLFNVRVRKQDGRMTSDVYDGTSYKLIDHKPVQTK